MSKKNFVPQLEKIKKNLKRQKIDHFILPNSDEFFLEYLPESEKRIQYLSGFLGSSATIIIGKNKSQFFTDGRYILQAKSELNLISNFLYHPKYFWQHPTLEVHFIMLERYLHIQRRVNAINHRLDTINEIFDMFNGYLENRHAKSLEIIIIILISIEIVFDVLNYYF